ncbi:MAG: hypothetical protein JO225_17515, partial [Candidatus Eremiobacteraeota bacterium]|nr:hypothetical protein [Candidatus Eremiobacteraeota bacterium]
MASLRRRVFAAAVSLAYATLVVSTVVRPLPARAALTCSLGPGKDGSPGTLAGTYNTYYQPPNGTLAAGSTTVPLGTIDTGGGGANTAVAANDLLLIVQMQDGTFNSSNSSSYGNGTGTGYTSVGKAGLYEYVAVSAVAGGNATVIGTGTGGGLINSYTEAAATGAHGQQSYQIIRVPQFVNATLGSTFAAAFWDGATGGVAALDIASTLNLGGASIYATGNGFRGGGLTTARTTPTSILNSDWAVSSLMNGAGNPPADGAKGEGILGTPDYLFEYTNFATPSTPAAPNIVTSGVDGYPGGDQARGAPGNAGGGGTDMDPVQNDENTGGGGGANGGAGGNGGYPWTPNYNGNTAEYYVDVPGQNNAKTTAFATADGTHNPDIGGRGGSALTPSVTRLFMGGGGGAGSNNDGSNNNSNGADGSSGGVGGGIIMLRIADTSGTAATFFADGTTGLAPDNDGGGGGGAGGTVEITSPNSFAGITAHADGAAGTTAAAAGTAADSVITIQHGPGGGGGGGVVLSSSPVSATVAAGANGTTTSLATSYGATSGTAGVTQTINASQIPGVASGAECYTGGSGGNLFNGPVGANATTGSYNGIVPNTNNNDFTAVGFIPAGATLGNTGTTPGNWIGTTITQGPTTVNVRNEVNENNTSNATRTVTITATAPTSPAGWTAQVCRDNAGAISCTTGGGFTVGTAGATSTGTFTVPRHTNQTTQYWVQYSAPAGLTAFARYDAPIFATDNAGTPNTNWTHNELYPGYIVLTKQMTI